MSGSGRCKTQPKDTGWHFVGAKLRDGRPVPPDGNWLKHDGELVMCDSGLHYSRRLIDALGYAPGSTICRVEVHGWEYNGDKGVAMSRRILWRVDGEDLLRRFARLCALDVIHLWDAPEIVARYLKTGDESIRAASGAASWVASRAASWAASGAASRAASWVASWAASRDASWAASGAASWASSRVASRASSRVASWAASRDASRAASRDAQNRRLVAMVAAAHRKDGAR